jgi:hypothetical protein
MGTQEILSLEVEIEDRDGVTNLLQVSLQNSVGSGMLAGLVLDLAKDDFVSVAASPSKEKNDYGHYTTFINGQRYDSTLRKWIEVEVKKANFGDASWKDLQPEMLDKLEKHPAYKDREQAGSNDDAMDDDSPSNFAVFCQSIEAKKWPTPSNKDNHEAYLVWISDVCSKDTPFKSFDDIGDADWKAILQVAGIAKADRMPAVLKAL